MRRVYAVWFLKKLTSPLALKGYAFIALLFGIFVQVSVANVLANAPGLDNVPKNIIFFTRAFVGSEPIVQVVVLSSLLLLTLLLRDAFTMKRGVLHRAHVFLDI